MIKDKSQLEAEIIAFADGSGITAAQLRAYFVDILDSKVLQIKTAVDYAGPTQALTPADIDENILHTSSVPIQMQLPAATIALLGRQYVHTHFVDDDIEFVAQNPGDVVNGVTLSGRKCSLRATVTGVGQWTVLENPLTGSLSEINVGSGLTFNTTDPAVPLFEVETPDNIMVNEDGATLTTPLTQNVWTDVACQWTPLGIPKNFTNTVSTVTYTGPGGWANCDLRISGRHAGGGAAVRMCSLGIAVNGTVQPGQSVIDLTALDDNPASLQTRVDLTTGDVITVQILNTEGNQDFELRNINLSVNVIED